MFNQRCGSDLHWQNESQFIVKLPTISWTVYLKCSSQHNMHQTITDYSMCRKCSHYSGDKSISITFDTIMADTYNFLLSIFVFVRIIEGWIILKASHYTLKRETTETESSATVVLPTPTPLSPSPLLPNPSEGIMEDKACHYSIKDLQFL